MQKTEIKLGDLVRDKITGLLGVAVVKSEYLNGCVRFGVQPRELHEGKPIDSFYFDEPQLELCDPESAIAKQAGSTGGDRPNPRRTGL